MARTTPMRLVELMVLKQDISSVIEFLGKKGNFQFQSRYTSTASDVENSKRSNPDGEVFLRLQQAKTFLNPDNSVNIKFDDAFYNNATKPTSADRENADKFLAEIDSLRAKENELSEELKRVKNACDEAHSFANLKVPFDDLDHVSFLSLRVGRIDPALLDDLRFSVGDRAVIISLSDENGDRSKILAASSKKARFSLDSELKKFGFVNMEIPKDFKGVPEDVLQTLDKQLEDTKKAFALVEEEKKNLAKTHAELFKKLLASFSIGSQIIEKQNSLESTNLVYRMTGWIPESDTHPMMKELGDLTEGRIAIRVYEPHEVPSVIRGVEKVPVKLKHGKVVSAFERMIFSYGSPLYGTVDPTPFVAIFFTVLFGIMFGDLGQGLVFLLAGILMSKKVIKVGGWNKFAPIFMCIGISSSIMGFFEGEFFANTEVLLPVSGAIKRLFGITDPEALREPLFSLEFWAAENPIVPIFTIFGITIGLGFVINSIGLIINFYNNLLKKDVGSAFFGKIGLSGMLFFWYVVFFAIRIAAFGHSPAVYDWVIIGITLFCSAFGEPFERLLDGKRPVIENGIGALLIGGVVELIEVISTYLSNSISFVRVGAFALAHAVLGYIISSMVAIAPAAGAVVIAIVGNAIVIVLEGMIVAIQVIRLQYYEFFSKFFNETGSEFKPFAFSYK
ncbi:MAG: ATPase [Treponema sp.]|nr:ATPase [Treponema sp.]